jgi:hypothetical protein
MSNFVTVWALAWLAVVVTLTVLRGRIGALRTGAMLVVIGVALLVFEEPALTLWLGLVGPSGDADGMSGRVTAMARAHVLDAAIISLAASAALIYVALRGFRKGHRWSWPVLVWGFHITLAAELITTLFVFSRGLAVPGAAGDAGRGAFGWQPVAVALLAWGLGLVIGRPPIKAVGGEATDTHVTGTRKANV